MGISDNLKKINAEIGADVTLVAVSKYTDNASVQEAFDAGQRDFGENKAQALDARRKELPEAIRWHFIGHLQRNKVKYIVDYVHMVHSVDSWRLLREINKRAAKADRVIPCLLQMHIAKEESKFGLDREELDEILKREELSALKNIEVVGLMGMATNTDKAETVAGEFADLRQIFTELKAQQLPPNVRMERLSMGMTQDYKLALEAGSNMVRIGSAVFNS